MLESGLCNSITDEGKKLFYFKCVLLEFLNR